MIWWIGSKRARERNSQNPLLRGQCIFLLNEYFFRWSTQTFPSRHHAEHIRLGHQLLFRSVQYSVGGSRFNQLGASSSPSVAEDFHRAAIMVSPLQWNGRRHCRPPLCARRRRSSFLFWVLRVVMWWERRRGDELWMDIFWYSNTK